MEGNIGIVNNPSLSSRYNLKPEMSFKQIRDIFQVTKEIDITDFVNFNIDHSILNYQKYFGAYYNIFKRLGKYMRLQPMVESSALCSYTQCKCDELNLVNRIYKKYNLLAKVKNRPIFVENTGKNKGNMPVERLGLEDLISDALFITNNLGNLKHINIVDMKFTTKRESNTNGNYEIEQSLKIGNIRVVYNTLHLLYTSSMRFEAYSRVNVALNDNTIPDIVELYLTLNGIMVISRSNKTFKVEKDTFREVGNFKPSPEDVQIFHLW